LLDFLHAAKWMIWRLPAPVLMARPCTHAHHGPPAPHTASYSPSQRALARTVALTIGMVRLVSVAGDSARPLWKTWQWDRAIGLSSGQALRYLPHYRPPPGPTGGSNMTPPNWSIWIQILLFKYEFDRLNWKTSRFLPLGLQKIQKITKNFKFPPPTNTPMVWAHFTPLPSHFHSLLHTYNIFIQLKRNGGLTHHGVSGRHGRSHEHVASGRCRGYSRFFINMRVKPSSMIRQSWSWSDSFQTAAQLLQRRLRVPLVLLSPEVSYAEDFFLKHYA
jgi:hypothetical protein